MLDDVPLVFRDRAAQQIFLAALDGQPGQPRLVSYRRHRECRSFQFAGAIVGISNLSLPADAMAEAIRSRIPILRHAPTAEQLAAVMRHQARQGHERLSPAQCLEVADLLIHESAARGRRLDLRVFYQALRDRLQYEQREAESDWRDLVLSLLESAPVPAVGVMSKKEELAAEEELLIWLDKQYPGDTAKQLKESGMKPSTFYGKRRRLGLGRRGKGPDSRFPDFQFS